MAAEGNLHSHWFLLNLDSLPRPTHRDEGFWYATVSHSWVRGPMGANRVNGCLNINVWAGDDTKKKTKNILGLQLTITKSVGRTET
jgi:hypothetical protein